MSKFLNTLVIGAASGAAAAYFFTTEKGKAVKARIDGDITADDLTKAVQEKTAQVAEIAKDSFELIKEKTAQVTPEQAEVEANSKAMVDDIVIDIKDISEAAAESEAN